MPVPKKMLTTARKSNAAAAAKGAIRVQSMVPESENEFQKTNIHDSSEYDYVVSGNPNNLQEIMMKQHARTLSRGQRSRS